MAVEDESLSNPAGPSSPRMGYSGDCNAESSRGIHPPDLTNRIELLEPFPVCSEGANADILLGRFKRSWTDLFVTILGHPLEQQRVAIKRIRVATEKGSESTDKAKRRHEREIALWHRLSHPNILPFLGVSTGFGKFHAIISPWQANGNLSNYLAKYPNANRYELMLGVASGLAYLHAHSPPIVHGDLKPPNILVNDHGAACIADFGISRVAADPLWATRTVHNPGTVNYMATELLYWSQGATTATTQSDVWAFGVTLHEVLSGNRPFSEYKNGAQVMMAVVDRHERPIRDVEDGSFSSRYITDPVWSLIEQCWEKDPARRPSMATIERTLREICVVVAPLKLLAFDGDGAKAIASLLCLDAIMKDIHPDAKPCDYFDLIAGSGTGGVIALMLGRLRMSIPECLNVLLKRFPAIYNERDMSGQIRRLRKGKTRFSMFDSPDFWLEEDIVNQVLASNDRRMRDRRPDMCRTFVIAHNDNEDISSQGTSDHRLRSYHSPSKEAFPHRIWVAMACTMSTPLTFGETYPVNFSLEHFSNAHLEETNPTLQLIHEAREVFGTQRQIGCLISLGTGLDSMPLKDNIVSQIIPDNYLDVLRKSATSVQEVDKTARESLPYGTYYRFDPTGEVNGLFYSEPSAWIKVVALDQCSSARPFIDAVLDYLRNDEVKKMIGECAARLQGSKSVSYLGR